MSVTFFIRYNDVDEVNVSNSNARELLRELGYDFPDLIGNMPATELVARCQERLISLEKFPDPGRPSFREGNMIYGGRPEGYIRDRLRSLSMLGVAAISSGQDIIYFG